MKGRRVFIGLPAGPELRDAVAGFRKERSELKVRWIRQENLHVTMVAPWELEDPAPVCGELERIAGGYAVLPVLFDSVSSGPDQHRPRLVWAKGNASPELSDLFGKLQLAFGSTRGSSRPFLLHMTIARLGRDESSRPKIRRLRETVDWPGLIDAICLYESILLPHGVEYLELCRYSLLRK